MDPAAIDAESSRAELVDALMFINTEAMSCHPSPRWDDLHRFIDRLLDRIVGL
jgi:hypothetical protein